MRKNSRTRSRSARRARRRRSRCARAAYRPAKSIANALIAQNGMQAALLAAHGVTGPLDLFEAERGLKACSARAGGRRHFRRAACRRKTSSCAAAIKAYPCFAGGQSAVAAAIALHRLVDGNVDRLASIRVGARRLAHRAPAACRSRPRSRRARARPPTTACSFSSRLRSSTALSALRQFDNERWNDPKVARADGAPGDERPTPIWRAAPAKPIRAPSTRPAATAGTMTSKFSLRPASRRDGLDPQTVLEKFTRVTATHLSPGCAKPDRRRASWRSIRRILREPDAGAHTA